MSSSRSGGLVTRPICHASLTTLACGRAKARLEQSVAALDVTLTPGELAVLEPLGDRAVGARY